MRVPYTWYNTFQNKKRTLAAVAGITFSVLLVFMQLGFLDIAKRGSTLLYRYLDFDLIITSDKYELLTSARNFDRARLIQAMIVPGVKEVVPLNIGSGAWEDPDTKVKSGAMLIGVDLNPSFFRDEGVKARLGTLAQTKTVMLDLLSSNDYGELTLNRKAKINGVDVTVKSLFKLGMVFYNDGAVIVNNQTFQSLNRGNSRMVTFGLIKVSPGADIMTVKGLLRENLHSDVLVFDRQELISNEQDYYIRVVPVGIMFQVGVFIAFGIGAVILFQVLATEITNKLNEYAILKAMGFTNLHIYSIGFKQAFLFAFMGYIPSMAFSYAILYFLRTKAKMPAKFTPELAGFVFILTVIMCLISGFLALQKVRKADPADLF